VQFATGGSYLIGVSAAQRGNNGTSQEEVTVRVDDMVVGAFAPESTSYATYTTVAFQIAPGQHTITFAGVDPSGADYSAFLDQASVERVAPAGFSDPGFEIPSQGAGPSAYQNDPTGSAWTFSGSAGLAGNGSDFTSGNSEAP